MTMRFPTRKPWLWHRWFAWWPVQTNTERVWFKRVWRKRVNGCLHDWWIYSNDEPEE